MVGDPRGDHARSDGVGVEDPATAAASRTTDTRRSSTRRKMGGADIGSLSVRPGGPNSLY
ncbi:hypothetical protein I552_5023 [Mycobacterium xenopi 3993]|nr:hypothetical protein I552_5023 [Mycobacterium xenopi 3993]